MTGWRDGGIGGGRVGEKWEWFIVAKRMKKRKKQRPESERLQRINQWMNMNGKHKNKLKLKINKKEK